MVDTQTLQDAVVVAEDALAALLVARRDNRETMTRAEFVEYNEGTRADQLQVTKDADDANQALRDHMNAERSDVQAQIVSVGTLNEINRMKGVTP